MHWHLIPLVLGIVIVCAGGGLDFIVRLRLRKAGERDAFVSGGTLDYRRYLRICDRFGWSPWTVFLIPTLVLVGFALVILWLFNP